MIFNNVISQKANRVLQNSNIFAHGLRNFIRFSLFPSALEYAYILVSVGVNYQHLAHKNTSVSSFCSEGRYGSNLFELFSFVLFLLCLLCFCFCVLCLLIVMFRF